MEPPGPQRGMTVDDRSVETLPRHTSGTDGARPEHGVLVRCKYGLLEPAGTTINPADAGDTGSKAVHGVTGDQDMREPEEEKEVDNQ